MSFLDRENILTAKSYQALFLFLWKSVVWLFFLCISGCTYHVFLQTSSKNWTRMVTTLVAFIADIFYVTKRGIAVYISVEGIMVWIFEHFEGKSTFVCILRNHVRHRRWCTAEGNIEVTLYYRVIVLISVNIVPSWDIEGRELASVCRYEGCSKIT